MSEQTIPAIELHAHGRIYRLAHWLREDKLAEYFDKLDNQITQEWQDENRTWLTIDEVYATRWDCMAARCEAASQNNFDWLRGCYKQLKRRYDSMKRKCVTASEE